MIANGIHKSENQQRKSHHIQQDEESQQLNIQPPKKEMTIHTDFDIKYEETDRHIIMYIELDPKNVANLTKQANKNKTYDDQRKFYKDCIFIRKIQTPESHLKGNFRIHFLHYKGLSFAVQFMRNDDNIIDQQEVDAKDMYSRMKLHYKTPQNWEVKWIEGKQEDEKLRQNFSFQIPASEVDKILKQKLLLEIIFEKSFNNSKDFVGILNEGNTCYANSTLQVLFHFKPLRKMIVELPIKKQNKLTKAMQQVFVDLITQKSAVRAQSLLHCFQKILDEPHRQQDIHQFLISFFDCLDSQLHQATQFWTGKDFQTTFSKQAKYQSKQQQNFTQLQLQMADTKGNQHREITQSLRQLLEQDKADEPIDTDDFGKLTVYKKRHFCTMPPLLFMNIKRYEYNPKRRQLKKINLDLSYPSIINLDFLMNTPSGLDYVLYAVVVHKGRTPNSGHYFCFINVSQDPDTPNWYEFNDSIVRKAKQSKVLNNYTGKRKQQIYLNQQYGKWAEKQQVSEQTAYLLTYIHKDSFSDFQSIDIVVPTWHIERIQKKLTQQQSRTMVAVKFYVLRNEDYQFRPYELNFELQQAKLNKQQTLQSEVKKLQKMLSCTVGTIWKVNCKTRTIKHISKDYGQQCRITVDCHTQFKRGIRQLDYFIIVPEERMASVEDWQHKKLVFLQTQEVTEQEIKEKVQILAKEDIQTRIKQMKKEGANVQYDKEEFEQFVYGWNDYLHLKKQI